MIQWRKKADITNDDHTTGWKQVNPWKGAAYFGIIHEPFLDLYLHRGKQQQAVSLSKVKHKSVILFMHLSLLALLPCVLSLGVAACCAPESWHAQAEGRGSRGKDRRLYEYPERASTEHKQWSFSSAPTLLSWVPAWPSGVMGWWVRNFVEKNKLKKAVSIVRVAYKGICWLKSADGYILLLL